MISRWERGTLAPHRSYLDRLRMIAGQHELVQVGILLNDPIPNWTEYLVVIGHDPEFLRQLEIVAINNHKLLNEDDGPTLQLFGSVLNQIMSRLVEKYLAGEPIFLFTDAQRNAWLDIVRGHHRALNKPGKQNG